MDTLRFGIRKDLQADVRHEPNACNGYVLDLSLGCSHQCLYCIFSPLEKKVYRLFDPAYGGEVIPLKLDRLMSKQEFPPVVYMCYSSDPLAGAAMVESTKRVLKKLFSHNVSVFFLTKGVFTDDVLEVMAMRPDLMAIQVGIASCDHKRNRLIEPGVPSYDERLENFRKLSRIEGLSSLGVRMDPLFPVIDDSLENVDRVLADVAGLGVREAVLGYVVLTESLREELKKNPFLRASMAALSEKTPTISNRSLFSFPFDKKLEKLEQFQDLCFRRGMTMAACGCKDERLKGLSIPWICHPFKRAEEQPLSTQARGPA